MLVIVKKCANDKNGVLIEYDNPCELVRYSASCLELIYPMRWPRIFVPYGLLVGCLTSRQHASVSQSQRRICSDNFMCCHTEIEVADQNF